MSSIAFHTLGCKVNQYDTQAMLELFRKKGYTVVDFQLDADIYLINTCTVTGVGDKKSMQLTRKLKREHPMSQIILAGCLAQRKGEELLSTGARLILGTQNRHLVVELFEKAMAENRQICAVEPLDNGMPFENLTICSQEEHTRATLKIQEGCCNHCTYCIIPSVRGPIRSRSLDEIEEETRRLSRKGFQEIVVTGIHLTSYGRDMNKSVTLMDALERIASVDGIERIRLGSLEPNVATLDFAKRAAQLGKICPQFHLALQSGSDAVLARMKRQYNTSMYRKSVENLRSVFLRAAFTTDILTGFPGETDDEFQETLRMISEIGYAKIHVFPYSMREGTPAASMPGQLSAAEKENRARELIAEGEKSAEKYRQMWLGSSAPVLLETRDSMGKWQGYTPEYIHVTVEDAPCCRQGATVNVLLTEITPQGMKGHII